MTAISRILSPALSSAPGEVYPTWSPAVLGARVVGWWEADYGVTESGGRVSAWASRRGAAPAVQATGANQPRITTTGGRLAIQMDDTARFLTVPKASAPTPGTGATVYWVGSTTSTSLVIGVWGLWGTLAADAVWLHVLNDDTSSKTAAYISETGTHANRASKGAGDPSDGNDHVNVLRWSGTEVTASLDGASASPVACAGAKSPTVNTLDFAIGRYQPLLANPAGVVNHRALIFVTGHEAPGSATDLLMRAYLKRKWGTP